jgi:hypothetical protein
MTGRSRQKDLTPECREIVVLSLMADIGMSQRRANNACDITCSMLRYWSVPLDDSGYSLNPNAHGAEPALRF